MTDFPAEAVETWAHNVAFIRENGQQVVYADDLIPEAQKAHDEMLRVLLAWQRGRS